MSDTETEHLAPPAALPSLDGHPHFVQFYETDDYLVSSVADFVSAGLKLGDAAVVVATGPHRDALQKSLTSSGHDVADAVAGGRLVLADAREVMTRFMRDGVPNGALFEDVIGQIVTRASAGGRGVRIFGEMVALLWADGNVPAAIRVEELWNDLAGSQRFALFCAYPMTAFKEPGTDEAFTDVCATHSHVLPAEGYARLTTVDEKLRAVASLQQQTIAARSEREALRVKQIELEGALERLEELDRLRNEFVAMVVHDIRAPAAMITGFLEVLRENWGALDEERIRDLLSKGIDHTKQIRQLVGDMLTVARLESGEFTYTIKPFDLAEVIYRVVGAVRDAMRGVEFEVSVPANLPRALGDEARQMQILTNLITNAVKFSPTGKTVYLSVAAQDAALTVSVRDEGPGIAEWDKPKLFRRFSRLDNPRRRGSKGSGLGLYISKALVEGQGGSIWVRSKKGSGSTFSYSVPLA